MMNNNTGTVTVETNPVINQQKFICLIMDAKELDLSSLSDVEANVLNAIKTLQSERIIHLDEND